MTALTTTTRPASTAAQRPHLVDAPTDYRGRVTGIDGTVHRFPAATYLCRSVAREERAIARAALEATDRSASRRIGAIGAALTALFVAALVVLGTGRTDTQSGRIVLACLGVAMVLVVVALVVVLRRHERAHDTLAERVRMYDARLLELRPRR